MFIFLFFNVSSNQTYYVQIWGYNSAYSATSSYSLQLNNVVPSATPIYLNSIQDISGSVGQAFVYSFILSSTASYKIFTGPYGGYGGSNDTVIEIYSDRNLTNMLYSNDDSDGTLFSKVVNTFQAGTSYYIKVRPYSTSGSLYARLKIEYDVPPIPVITENSTQNVTVNQGTYKAFKFTPTSSGKYKFATSSNGSSSDTYLELYSDANLSNLLAANDDSNGTLYSTIEYEMSAGVSYYIKFRGYGDNAASAYLTVSNVYKSIGTYVQTTIDSTPQYEGMYARDYDGSVYVNVSPDDEILIDYDPTYYFIENGQYWFYIHHLSYYMDIYLSLDRRVMMITGEDPTDSISSEDILGDPGEITLIQEETITIRRQLLVVAMLTPMDLDQSQCLINIGILIVEGSTFPIGVSFV